MHQQQQTQAWPFTVQVVWLPKYASWLDQIEIWFRVLQRQALPPNHFSDLPSLKQHIPDFIAHYDRSARPIRWSYTADRLLKLFATNPPASIYSPALPARRHHHKATTTL